MMRDDEEHHKTKPINLGLLAFILLSNFLIPAASSEKSGGVCTSKGGRFPSFSLEGKPPKKVSRGSKDLTLCRLFRKRTCCDAAQTHPALLTIRRLASTGEASQDCLHLWELLECSICDPLVGIQPGPPLVCVSFCDKVFETCSGAYFSMDTNKLVLAPCGVHDFVCGRVSEWVSNGTELCHAAGFGVKNSEDQYSDAQETSCYGGKASLESIADSWQASQSDATQKYANSVLSEDFLQWVQAMPINERVSWAVGGLVLTAGLLFVSKRKSHNQSQRQKFAAIQRTVTARRMEGKMSPKYTVTHGNRTRSPR